MTGQLSPQEIRARVDVMEPRTHADGSINARHVAAEQTLRSRFGHPGFIGALDGPGNFIDPTRRRMLVLAEVIRGQRYVYASERELQEQLAEVLAGARLPVLREVQLTLLERVDLLVADVALEVKVKGQRTPLAQLRRYAASPHVAGLLLVTTRAADLPPTIDGKPAAVVSLLANGLA